jgi:hypothetical protein
MISLRLAGDQARNAPRLAVVDFDQDSSRYGQVVATSTARAGASGNNHPRRLSDAGRWRWRLLSVLKGQPEIFFFDAAAASPTSSPPIRRSQRLPTSSIPFQAAVTSSR